MVGKKLRLSPNVLLRQVTPPVFVQAGSEPRYWGISRLFSYPFSVYVHVGVHIKNPKTSFYFSVGKEKCMSHLISCSGLEVYKRGRVGGSSQRCCFPWTWVLIPLLVPSQLSPSPSCTPGKPHKRKQTSKWRDFQVGIVFICFDKCCIHGRKCAPRPPLLCSTCAHDSICEPKDSVPCVTFHHSPGLITSCHKRYLIDEFYDLPPSSYLNI